MIELPGYQIIEQIYASSRTLVYRAIHQAKQQSVVIQHLRDPNPSFAELVRFRNRYTFTKNLNLPGIVQPYCLEPYRHGFALIVEDFDGISLSEYLALVQAQQAHTGLPLSQFFPIALQLVIILEGLYHHHIIHKDIKPSNLLINLHTHQIKLTDFSLATLLPREMQALQSPNVLEGTLAYLSPEQTGRMNRGIDYRSDFYAVGVTFFELLTGELPFDSDDPLELVHCHLTKHPPAVCDRNPRVPPMLSRLVTKLMAKNAEDRYQSVLGLKYDLEQCYQHWQEQGQIPDFPLGQRDVCDRFLIPEKLYGRTQEVAQLLAAFERIAKPDTHQSELVLVTGYSGIGKTAVVNEVHKPIARERGFFIKGKFDQFQRNIPFSAFVQALRELMEHLLNESPTQLAQWRSQIQSVLGEDGHVLIDVIPELEQILGAQPPAIELTGNAAQNRFNRLFQQFIQLFATADHPLVIFLDDLQWADSASLQLMQLLIGETKTGHLLLIGAYRNNEVSAAHPLMLTLQDIRQTSIIHTLTLAPLTFDHLNQLIADTLSCSLQMAFPLSKLTDQKTQGNPFFATQFLKALHQDGWITFNSDAGYWQCDITRVREAALTDDVVQFMALQIQKLPAQTQSILKLAACIGNQFDLSTLAIVSEQTETETAIHLWYALQEGLILPQSEIYKFFFGEETTNLGTQSTALHYKFLHDRVQQAAYSLIPTRDRAIVHYQIGQQLLHQISPSAREERIFELVNQLNFGRAQLDTLTDRDELAHLNLVAARKARAATAYQATCEYALVGIELLSETGWQRHYATVLALHELAAEGASLLGDLEQMQQWIDAVLHHTQTPLDQVGVCEIKIQALNSHNEFLAAIATGRSMLAQLGVHLPQSPTPAELEHIRAEIRALIGDRAILDLVHLPKMTDAQQLAIMQISNSIMSACYMTNSPLHPLVVALQVKRSIQLGNSVFAPPGYVNYALQLRLLWEDIHVIQQFGQLAYRLAAEPEAKVTRAATTVVIGGYVQPCTDPLRATLPIFQEGYQAGLETGNLEFVVYNIQVFALNAFWSGLPLADCVAQIQAYHDQLRQLNQDTTAKHYHIYWEAALVLLGRSPSEVPFCTPAYETNLIAEIHITKDAFRLGVFYLHRFVLHVLLQNLEQAEQDAVQARQHLAAYAGTVAEPIFYFYDSLSALTQSVGDSAAEAARSQRVQTNQALLQRWADSAPMNYLHKWQLVEAERYAVLGDKVNAIELYNSAIAGAKTNGFVQDEALANERAAQFYLHWGQPKIAQVYFIEAYYAYVQWSAHAKVTALEQQYPQFFAEVQSPAAIPVASTNTTVTTGSLLDIESILRASQTLYEELVLDQLLTKVMHIILENAGATKGVLLLLRDTQISVVAIATHAADEITLLPFLPLETSPELPHTLINSVYHRQSVCILDQPHADPQFTSDPYWRSHAPASVLGIPLLKRGQLIGILYLENQLTRGAFSADRVELLKVLCTQAAISIENARLYEQVEEYARSLEDKVDERTQALQQSEQQFRAMFEQAAIGMIFATPTGQFLQVNQAIVNLLGYTAEELLALGVEGITHPDDLPDSLHQTEQLFAGDRDSVSLEKRYLCKDGSVIWAHTTIYPIRDATGTITQRFAIIKDITERKHTETALRRSEARLAVAQRVAHLGNWEFDIATQAIHWSAELFRIYGLPPSQPAPTYAEFQHMVHPEDWPLLEAAIAAAMTHGTPYELEHRIIRPDGSVRYTLGKGETIFNADGQAIQLLGTCQDITTAKQAELSLRESEQRYANLSQVAPVGIFRFDNVGQCVYVNDRWSEMTGRATATAMGYGWVQALHPDDRDRIPTEWQQSRDQGGFYQGEGRYLRPDGRIIWFYCQVLPETNAHGEIIGYIGALTDITERVQLQTLLQQLNQELEQRVQQRTQELQHQTQLLETILNSMGDGVLVINTDGHIILHNPAAEQILGTRSPHHQLRLADWQQYWGVYLADGVTPCLTEQIPLVRALYGEAMDQAEIILRYPEQPNPIHVETTVRPLTNSTGQQFGAVAVFRDVSDRKRAEAERKHTENTLRAERLRLQLALEAADMGTWEANLDTGMWSPRTEAIFGYEPGTFPGDRESFLSRIYGDDRERVLATLTHSFMTQSPYSLEYRIKRLDGEVRWVAVSGKPVEGEDGQGLYMVGVALDITDRKQAEQSLRDSEERLRLALKAANQGLYDLNLQSGEVIVSPEYATMLGYDPALFQETNAQHLERLHPDDADRVTKVYEDYLAGLTAEYKVEFRQRTNDGNWKWILSLGKIVAWDAAGKPLRMLGTHTDISDRKHMEEALRQANIDLEKRVEARTAELKAAMEAAEMASRSKSTFLANMSHELRTPLNAILGFSQLLSRDTTLHAEHQTQLSIINRSGEHLLNLINDILEMSKIEAGRITFNPNPFDLHQLLDTLLHMFRLRAETKGLQLHCDRSPQLPRYIETDEKKLRQILINLIGNAIKFTEQGHITLRVDYQPQATQPTLCFAVSDTGLGVGASNTDSLFEPFVQTQHGQRLQEGTGLGLPISREFARLMGGDLTVTSIPGQGATFQFTIPVTLASATAIMPQSPSQTAIAIAPGQPTYRLLIVEDHPANRQLLLNLLQPFDFAVKAAVNGQEAIDLWQAWHPHLIWMDIRMPILDGYAAIKRIRELEAATPPAALHAALALPNHTHTLSRTVIIALSAGVFADEQAKVFALGCDDFVTKPLQTDVILNKMAEHLGVRYVYANTEPASLKLPPVAPSSSAQQMETWLRSMPLDWRLQFQQANIEVNNQKLLQLVQAIPAEQAPLAQALRQKIETYDFEYILRLLQKTLSP